MKAVAYFYPGADLSLSQFLNALNNKLESNVSTARFVHVYRDQNFKLKFFAIWILADLVYLSAIRKKTKSFRNVRWVGMSTGRAWRKRR